MNKNILKLSAIASGISLIFTSCYTPVPVYQTPPPQPVYTQAPLEQTQPVQQEQAPQPINYNTFYTDLSPYGQWVNNPNYGYVWIPAAGADFSPYATDGHWVYTDYGWTWASDYSWGWAPFHYGRWEEDPSFGWYWIPGYEWGPAWVSWRTSPGYYGWCPLGPTYVSGAYGTYYCPPQRYIFVQNTYITSTDVYSYCAPREQNETFIRNSTVINNTYVDNSSHTTYYGGPSAQEVGHITNSTVTPVKIHQAGSAGQTNQSGNELVIYRPPVKNPETLPPSEKPAPPRVYQAAEIKPVAQREIMTKPAPPRPVNNNEQRQQASPVNNNNQQRQIVQPEQQRQITQPEQQKQVTQPEQQRQVSQPEQQRQIVQPEQQKQVAPPQQQRQAAPAQNNNNQKKQINNQLKQNKQSKQKPLKQAPPPKNYEGGNIRQQ